MDFSWQDYTDKYEMLSFLYKWTVSMEENKTPEYMEEHKYDPIFNSINIDKNGNTVYDVTINLRPDETIEDYIQYFLNNGFELVRDNEEKPDDTDN